MFIPVIMSGGSGTRLWPLSRQTFPKQFVDLFDGSLLGRTLQRVQLLGAPWVITVESMKILTEKTYREVGLNPKSILFEPKGKNTAAAVALATKVLSQKFGTDVTVGIFPADHLIANQARFLAGVNEAIRMAREGQIVTLGIQPDHPATGYGYIEVVPPTSGVSLENPMACRVQKFHEKPTLEKAKEYCQAGRFFWNAGMFVFTASTMQKAFQEHMPDLWNEVQKLAPDLSNLAEIYDRVPAQSLDYGIMEKAKNQMCVPCDLGWSDVGSWDEVAKLKKEVGEKYEVRATNNFVSGQDSKVYGLIGLNDLIVVDTQDALLIARKGESQAVKDLLDQMKSKAEPAATEHVFEHRPWGSFEVLRDTERFKSKIIRVEPGQQISYQSHDKRAEHWVITKGSAEVTLNDEKIFLKTGENVFIPIGAKHQIRNSTSEVVEFVEVQVGSYFGEDDIKRYSDIYGRT